MQLSRSRGPSGYTWLPASIGREWGDVNPSHCLTKKVLEMGSLPQLRKVLEMGGKATVTRC
jgi:hypothetical protein